jgi:hypothetical protein
MSLKILIRRDAVSTIANLNYVPKQFELIAGYSVDRKEITYKIGDGVTPWTELEEITKLSELDNFIIYTNRGSIVELYLNPNLCDEVLERETKLRKLNDEVKLYDT